MRKLNLFAFVIINVLSISLFTSSSYADVESENAILAQISHELDALQPLINEAEKQQPPYTRIHFNYARLRSDINKIQNGIQQQLKNTYVEPRAVQPLSGDYVQVESLKP